MVFVAFIDVNCYALIGLFPSELGVVPNVIGVYNPILCHDYDEICVSSVAMTQFWMVFLDFIYANCYAFFSSF